MASLKVASSSHWAYSEPGHAPWELRAFQTFISAGMCSMWLWIKKRNKGSIWRPAILMSVFVTSPSTHFRAWVWVLQRRLVMVDLMSLKYSTGLHRDRDCSDWDTHLPLVHGIWLSILRYPPLVIDCRWHVEHSLFCYYVQTDLHPIWLVSNFCVFSY